MNHAQRRKEQRKGFSRTYDEHHRIPRSRRDDPIVKGFSVYHRDNISVVRTNLHTHHHALFANLLTHEIADVLNSQWIDSRSLLVAVWKNRPGLEEWLDHGRKMGFLYG
jgi:hypothetical protein